MLTMRCLRFSSGPVPSPPKDALEAADAAGEIYCKQDVAFLRGGWGGTFKARPRTNRLAHVLQKGLRSCFPEISFGVALPFSGSRFGKAGVIVTVSGGCPSQQMWLERGD